MHCMIFITENKFCSYVAFDESLFEFVKKNSKSNMNWHIYNPSIRFSTQI
jgi:hypothetical protein